MLRGTCLWLAIPAVLLGTPATAQDWTPIGPPGGNVRALAADPRAPQRVYLGTADGVLFRSDDGGRSWRAPRPGFPRRGVSLDQIAVDQRGVVLVGYWEIQGAGGGIARSVDGGTSFDALKGMEGESVRALAIAPSDPRVIAAGTPRGAFLSRDDGRTWTGITPAGHADLRNVESLAFDPTDPGILYLGTRHLAWKTLDGGITWQPVHEGMIDDSDVMSLTADPRDPRTIYATACTGIYRSTDGAARWTKLRGIPYSSRRTRAFQQGGADPRLLAAGTTEGLWISQDGGRTWRAATPDKVVVNALLVQGDSTIVLGTDGAGVLRSQDRGRTWIASNAGFSSRFVSRLLFDAAGPGLLAATNDDDGVFFTPGVGRAWMRLGEGLTGRHVLSLARMGEIILAGTDDGVFARAARATAWARLPMVLNGVEVHARVIDLVAVPPRRLLVATSHGMITSPDGGTSWTRPTLDGGDHVLGLIGFPDERDRIVAATDSGFFRTTNGGETWSRIGLPLPGVVPHAFAVVPSRQPTLLATTSGGLFRSDDQGFHWRRVAGGLPPSDLSGIAIHPDGRAIYVSDFNSGGIFRSLDGGSTWQRMSAVDLPSDHAWALAVDPAAPGRVLVSSASGLYVLASAPVAEVAAVSP